ncbi:hypothetical protein GQ602_005973 [Ophiocordyceps camponoti-floridani]|uniref:Uncharacterized protein n=1 Tax=Ophiocordyceps camponoti-floridani TaxID=2030778 RepID=A0A8H4Q2L5_9HYPO|nr:hypothetical protein GQ602_005973 [Ophiocordyceps camponoti-floridani]
MKQDESQYGSQHERRKEMALRPEQRRALFDILTHHQTYAEIQAFRRPETVTNYGFPIGKSSSSSFDDDDDENDKKKLGRGSAPVLQMLLRRFVLPLPGIRDLPQEFCNSNGNGTGTDEDDDGGTTGRRLASAWDEVLQGLVYGQLVDVLIDHITKTEDFESYSPTVASAVDYIIIHLAGFVHSVLIRSAEGPYLVKLISQVHGLIPYKLLKQTLRVGNAATMMSGISRLLLAKLSVASVTNWFGLTQRADDGMNLVQRIISLVLSWDAADFRKSADRVEKGRVGGEDRPSDEVLAALRQHIFEADYETHEKARRESREASRSIVAQVLGPEVAGRLTEAQHGLCMEYYSSLWSVRDRDLISAALCRTPPDLFTQAVKDGMAAYDPMIRAVHSNVDLRQHLEATQGFIDHLLAASRVGDDGSPPVVGDYVRLLRRNRSLLYRWLHALGKGCPETIGYPCAGRLPLPLAGPPRRNDDNPQGP